MNNHKAFAPNHAWDRNFYLGMIALAWMGILMGFGHTIAHHLAARGPAYPWIIHLHAFVFTGWLILFTLQILLIRWKKLRIHKQLGIMLAVWAGIMVIVGPMTAIIRAADHYGTPASDPAFFSVQFTDILGFTGLVVAAMWLRKAASHHKRLILVATLALTDAGFVRWLGDWLDHQVGESFWGLWIIFYAASNLLIILVGAYDLITRRRLHRAYLWAAAWIFANQMTALWLYTPPKPWWLAFCNHLIGH